MADLVCVGVVIGAHGVRGGVRLKSFTEVPEDIAAYGPVRSEDGRSFTIRVTGGAKGAVIATLDGVGDRNAAEALVGVRLFVPRDRLPETEEDEFLYSDLVGLMAETPDGTPLGRVKGVADFGAGEVLDIAQPGGGGLMVPFTRAAVPEVDVPGGRLVVIPPVFAPDEKDEEGERGREG